MIRTSLVSEAQQCSLPSPEHLATTAFGTSIPRTKISLVLYPDRNKWLILEMAYLGLNSPRRHLVFIKISFWLFLCWLHNSYFSYFPQMVFRSICMWLSRHFKYIVFQRTSLIVGIHGGLSREGYRQERPGYMTWIMMRINPTTAHEWTFN